MSCDWNKQVCSPPASKVVVHVQKWGRHLEIPLLERVAQIERSVFQPPYKHGTTNQIVDGQVDQHWFFASTSHHTPSNLPQFIDGYAWFVEFDKTIYLSDLAVVTEQARKGVGECLLKFALSCLTGLKKSIYTKASVDNTSVQALYSKLGFVDTGEKENGPYGTVNHWELAASTPAKAP